MMLGIILLSCALAAQPQLFPRDDATDGGGDPGAGDGNNGLTNWVGRPNHDPLEPARDSFYSKVPSNLTDYSNGELIAKRAISVSGTYQGVESAYQLRIRSEDAHDSAAVSLASVLIPRPDTKNGNVVVYQIPENAVYIDCAPTYQLFSRNAIPEVQSLISQGFIVVIPDYEGQRGSFTVGKLAGKQILDAARAAVTLPDVRSLNRTANVGIWGYGTGAFASGWAAEIAPTYAPELPLKAVALGGYLNNLRDWMNAINSSPNAAQVVTSLLGMATEYKDISDALADNIVPHRRSQFENAASRCSAANTLHFFETNITAEYYTPGIDILSIPKVQAVYDLNSLGKSAPRASLYIYQGTGDTVVSLGGVRDLVKSYCTNGTAVRYREISGATHNQARDQYEDVVDYLSNVLSNVNPQSSCQRLLSGGFYA